MITSRRTTVDRLRWTLVAHGPGVEPALSSALKAKGRVSWVVEIHEETEPVVVEAA